MHPAVLHIVAHSHFFHTGLFAKGINTRLQSGVGLRCGRGALVEARRESAFVYWPYSILTLWNLNLVLGVNPADLLRTLQSSTIL